MSLPPALLARLQKRGIIKKDNNHPEEEIIAESYDVPAPSEKGDLSDDGDWCEDDLPRSGAPGCPNKWNPYHLCVDFCYSHWGNGKPETDLSEDYLIRRGRMYRLYPLPDGWKEVYDPGMGRHYYWYPKTDEVSWLSPRHPRAVVGDSGVALAKDLKAKGENWNGIAQPISRKRRLTDHSDDKDSSDSDEDEEEEEDDDADLTDREKLKRAARRGIDPMDPAAYGDGVPLGGWNKGICDSGRKGADSTATGSRSQARPFR